MKNILFVSLLLISTVAMAQTPPATTTAPATAGTTAPMHPGGGMGGEREEKFADHKAKILERIEHRKACVIAAQNREAVKACFPEMGEGRGGEH